jgi:glycosyltransferase involved in cell wall biosynthesis
MSKSPLYYSIIVPVYNRPEELDQLLQSIALQDFEGEFEVVVVEDGSQRPALEVIGRSSLGERISYYQKNNTGPGDSRNYGMLRAKGSYFLLFDSDCILPKEYLTTLDRELSSGYVDFFGGPDDAMPSFTPLQRAINFVMTSKVSTGGVRGGSFNRFEPRSFNMGLSKEVFESTGGFGSIHPGEDPELSMRAWKRGFKSRLIPTV